MRYNRINITDEIRARGATPVPGQVLSFNSEGLPIFLTPTENTSSPTAALTDITASFYTQIVNGTIGGSSRFYRITNGNQINSIVDQVIVTHPTSTGLLNQEGQFGRFINADWQGVGSYGGVESLTGIPFGSNAGLWSSGYDPYISLGQVVIYGSTGTTGGFLHYQMVDAGSLNGTPPSVNTSAYTLLPKSASAIGQYGYVEKWYKIRLNRYTYTPGGDSLILSSVEDDQGNSVSIPPHRGWFVSFRSSFGIDNWFADGTNTITHFPWGRETVKNNRIDASYIDFFNLNFDAFESNEIRNSVIHFNTSVFAATDSGNKLEAIGNTLYNSTIQSNTFFEKQTGGRNRFNNNELINSSIEDSYFFGTDFSENQVINSTIRGLTGTYDEGSPARSSFQRNTIASTTIENLELIPYPGITTEFVDNHFYNSAITSVKLNQTTSPGISKNLLHDSRLETIQLEPGAKILNNQLFSATLSSQFDTTPLISNSSISENKLFPGSLIASSFSDSMYLTTIEGNRLDPSSSIQNVTRSSPNTGSIIIKDNILHSGSGLSNTTISDANSSYTLQRTTFSPLALIVGSSLTETAFSLEDLIINTKSQVVYKGIDDGDNLGLYTLRIDGSNTVIRQV
jgi:hypothetical protein